VESDGQPRSKTFYRIAKGAEQISGVQVSGRNTALDLSWAFQLWLNEEIFRDPKTGDMTVPDPIKFNILYRDSKNNWYKNICELGRDIIALSEVLYVRFITQQRCPSPPATVASASEGI
jgi:hypothetical protein